MKHKKDTMEAKKYEFSVSMLFLARANVRKSFISSVYRQLLFIECKLYGNDDAVNFSNLKSIDLHWSENVQTQN